MHKIKNQTKIAISAFVIVSAALIVGSGIFLPSGQGPVGLTYGKSFDLVMNSVVPSILIKCSTDDIFYYIDNNGQKHIVTETHQSITPYNGLRGFDISSYGSGQNVLYIGGTLKFSCNQIKTSLVQNLNLIGDHVNVELWTDNSQKKQVKTYSTSKQITGPLDVNGKTVTLIDWYVKASDVQGALGDSSPSFVSWQNVKYFYQLKFNQILPDNSVTEWLFPDFGDPAEQTYFRTLIQNNPPTIGVGTNAISQDVKLNFISPSNYIVDLSKSNRFFTVNGVLQNWTPAEGYPILTLYYTDAGSQQDKDTPRAVWALTSYTQSGTTFTFPFKFNMYADGNYGQYKLTLTSAKNSDGTFKRTQSDVVYFRAIKSAVDATICPVGSQLVNGACAAPNNPNPNPNGNSGSSQNSGNSNSNSTSDNSNNNSNCTALATPQLQISCYYEQLKPQLPLIAGAIFILIIIGIIVSKSSGNKAPQYYRY